MASYQPSPITTTSSLHHTLQSSSFLSHSGLNDTLHSTQSLSGRSSIMTYKNKQYPSASAALAAYINDFEGAHPLSMTYHRTVEDLLTPRSVLLRTVDRSLETSVRDTRAEWRRYVSKKLLDESYSEMMQADLERDRAQALIEASRHLTSDLSPLPGSSVITEMESEASMSTDALLLASPYPPLNLPLPPRNQEPVRKESRTLKAEVVSKLRNFRDRHQDMTARSHTEGRPRLKSSYTPQFPSDISPVKKLVTSSAPSMDRNSHSVYKSVNSGKFENMRKLQTRKSPLNDKSEVDIVNRRKGLQMSGTLATEKGNSPPKENLLPGSQRPLPILTQDLKSSGVSGIPSDTHLRGRAPPSWVQDLDTSGLTSVPSQAQASGRAPPSWVQDLETSGISKTQEQTNGGRPLPSWIQDLNSTLSNSTHAGNPTSRQAENLTTLESSYKQLSPQKPQTPLQRSNSASGLIAGTNRPPGLTVRDFETSEQLLRSIEHERFQEIRERPRDLASSGEEQHSRRAVKFSGKATSRKTRSFTTDDLILASPTGKGFHLTNHNAEKQYSPNIFSNKSSSLSNSGHQKTKYNNHLATQRHFSTARELVHHKRTSARQNASDLLSSTPKYRVNFKSRLSKPSMNGYVNDEGLLSLGRSGYYMKTHTSKSKLSEDDLKSEDALLERAQKVLDAAKASRNKPSDTLLYPHEAADREEDVNRHDNSLLTEEILDGDRPWERHLPSLKPVNGRQDQTGPQDSVSKFLKDCQQLASDQNQKLTSGSQPGPVEALKNMLFTLQGLDTKGLTSDIALTSETEKLQTTSATGTSSPSPSRSKTSTGH
ncbi:uncharacterized protein LOC110987466 isoform X2 [Acanthaster planci]|uniref:Uncharacterized protein LOC110987466 isoform X2 n=1 Tax=Acanthaster planci TaxID=133434 RepID=A0A8B7ZLH6_ACAPL|nr:uncharacterized protein LOC110987466 isoform X2 [Acanthaster planci]XP_022105907.1 uncharacterized protein LOC110987466 isoform X2 [Acanthaster planci]